MGSILSRKKPSDNLGPLQIVAEQTFDVQALQAVVAKKVSTTARREAVEWLRQTRSTSLASRVVWSA